MSAMPDEPTTTPDDAPEHPQGAPAPESVTVRRHAGVAALVGAAASAVAIGYLWRAVQTAAVLDWTLFAVMAAIAGGYLAALVDARTPLLVADGLGVRIRLGAEWRGLPWDAIGQVVVHPRSGLLRDGRLVFLPRSLARALDGLDPKGRRHVALNQRMYGAALAVPLGLTTRTTAGRDASDLSAGLAALAAGRAEVVELEPRTPSAPSAGTTVDTPPVSVPDRSAPEQDDPTDAGRARRRTGVLGGLATVVSRVAKGRDHDIDRPEGPDDGPLVPAAVPASLSVPMALRETRSAQRAEARLDPTPTEGSAALSPDRAHDAGATDLPERRHLRRPGSVDLVVEPMALDPRVRPISSLGEPVEPLVIDDFVTEPAYDPVIGPELAAARTRIGLSVDELADRTRIRPHVIEAIEVDDFAPCGGDFYARGHLRTLARILGKDPAPMLATFDERYATAPISPRRVFEAELATGMTGSMRSTVGGQSWGLLVGVVLCLVLVWGVVRFFTAEPVEMVEVPAPVLNGSAVIGSEYAVDPAPATVPGMGPGTRPAAPVPVRLTASQSDTRVVVRDGDRTVVFRGLLVLGERRTLRVSPPVRVGARDGGAVEVTVRGRDRGFLGEAGEPARRTFR